MSINFTLPIQIFIAMTYCTYLIQENLPGGEYVAEGVPLIIGLLISLFFLIKVLNTNVKVKYKPLFIVYFFYFIYIILTTLSYIILESHNPLRLLFMYQYFPVFTIILMLGNEHIFHINKQAIFITIGFFAAISAIYGILQFLGFEPGVPIDINRARGLSRSTLNYSSLMFLGFVAATLISKKSLSAIFSLIIFAGVVASQGRGGIFATVIFFTIYTFFSNFKVGNILVFVATLIAIFIAAFSFLPEENLQNFEILAERLAVAFDTNDPSNNQRLYSMTLFFDEFRIFGLGAGITGPAAERFQSGTGYESFILATIVQGGLFGLLMMFTIWSIIFFRLSQLKIEIFAFLTGLFFMMLVQQTLETPTVNLMVWLLLTVLVATDTKSFKYEITSKEVFPPMWSQVLGIKKNV